jgi:hypothetical protein
LLTVSTDGVACVECAQDQQPNSAMTECVSISQQFDTSQSITLAITLGGVFAAVVCLGIILIVLAFFISRRRRHREEARYVSAPKIKGGAKSSSSSSSAAAAARTVELQAQPTAAAKSSTNNDFDDTWELNFSELSLGEQLSNSDSGPVYVGTWRSQSIQVITLPLGSNNSEHDAFKRQAQLMKKLRPHKNGRC